MRLTPSMTASSVPGPSPSGLIDVAVVEDVWGWAFDELAGRRRVERQADAWNDPDALASLAARSRALVVRNRTPVTRELLVGSPTLELVGRAGTGVDNIDVAAADELGVVVVSTPGASARSVAEHAICLALALARDLPGHERRLRQGLWERRLGIELAGRTWGVVGLGNTGQAVARLAQSIGMEVMAHDPYLSDAADPVPEVRRIGDLFELAETADVVSLHAPLNDTTAGLVGAAFLDHMRPDSFLVNVARGGLVDEEALADALDAGRPAGAALDVRTHEPPVPGRLDRHERVILTPHVAGLTQEAQLAVVAMLADDIDRVLTGAPATHPAGKRRRPGERPSS